MNEKKKVVVVLVVLAVLVLLVSVLVISGINKSQKIYDNFQVSFTSDDNKLVYIGKPTCSYCNLLSPSLSEMADRYDFEYTYINTDDLSLEYYNKVIDDLGADEIGTPYLAIVNNGEVVDEQRGYVDYDMLFEFLQDNEIINEDEKLLLNYIGLDEYKELLDSNKNEVIVIGQSTCGYCVEAKLILNEVIEQTDAKINYLNVTYLQNDNDKYEEFKNSLDYFKESFGTPVMLIVKDGEIVDKLETMAPKDEYISFLEENGVL